MNSLPDDQKLDELIKRSEDAIKRLESLQSDKLAKAPLSQRAVQHVSRHGGFITNVLLAGCVLAVAVGRLDQKQKHEFERRAWEEEQGKLLRENERLKQEVSDQEAKHKGLVDNVHQELQHRGWGVAPLAARIIKLLDDGRPSPATANSTTTATTTTAKAEEEPSNPSKIMV